MRQFKVCMLGAPNVGKTSLVRRYVQSIFDDTWRTTIGVNVSKKTLEVHGAPVVLMLWDLAGFGYGMASKPMSYLRGMSGYLLVADGTRPSTLDDARSIYERVFTFEQPPPEKPDPDIPYIPFPFRGSPFLLLLNKSDMIDQWKISDSQIRLLRNKGWPVYSSSAKANQGVEEAFLMLGLRLMESVGNG